MNQNDLDNSNVLYDEDFEINEEEKVDTSNSHVFHPSADNVKTSNLFNNHWLDEQQPYD